jgi:prepilin-type N-terminal cleavage/methylation domain-containing protein
MGAWKSSNRFAARRRKSQGSPSRVARAFHRGPSCFTGVSPIAVLPLLSGDALDAAEGAGRPSRARRNANEPAVRRAVLLRFGRNIAMRGSRLGFTLIEILVVVAIGGVLITLTLFGLSCDGTCASVPCSETAPCTFAGSSYTIGNACAPNVEGSVCDSNGFFPDCVCRNSVGPGNVLRAVCVS